MLQPDLGSAMVLATAAAFGVLLAAGRAGAVDRSGCIVVGGARRRSSPSGPGCPASPTSWPASAQLRPIPQHDRAGQRRTTSTRPHIAIANGGLFGTGLFNGPQTNGGYVPEQRTDFVFSVMGEEFGLVGGAVLILLFGLLCWRGLRIARQADRTGQLVAVGIVCWFAFQIFQNIGMNLGLMPVTGLPLPFVSYGGSSMFAQGLAIGLLQAVRKRSLG